MEPTLEELKDKLLQQYSEVDILELLNISTEEILNAFSDRIEEKYIYLISQVFEGEEDEI